MHRFYLPPEACRRTALVLGGSEAHHALRVLRLRANESVVVLDGAGGEYHCAVTALQRREVELAVTRRNSVPPLPYQLTLAQALPKGKLMETIIQKATELGVHRIVPLLSDRVVTQLDDERAETRLEKWRATAIEAVKQCGSAWLPRIEPAVTPAAWLSHGEKFDLTFIGSLQPDARHPREWLRRFREQHGRAPVSVCVWVGPEGDFTAAELRAAQDAGARPITLGRLVMRCDTAAVSCLAVLNSELQWAEH